MSEVDLKNYIQAKLQTLIPNTLKDVQCDDFSPNFLTRESNVYPLAVVTSPVIDSAMSDSNDNQRTYTFDILVVQKGENIQSSTDMESLRQTIMDLFDKDQTFGGNANAGVLPSSSRITGFTENTKSWVGFVITLQPKALAPLS